MASTPLSRTVHRPVKTCTECKQVKLRCDSKAKFPAPCSRCQTRNLQCVVDSTFRRTPARKRVEEMARELEALKNQKAEEFAHKSTVSPSIPDSSDSPEYTLENASTPVLDDSGLGPESFQLGNFVMDRDTTVEIFKIFTIYFYPHFPVLNPHITISTIHDTSPLLFWTIVAIVVSRAIIPSHPPMFLQLQEPFLQRLRTDILRPPVPLSTIQALTYLIMWPFPAERQTHDPSWLYSGTAINAALYMGLHHAKPAQSLRSIGVAAGSVRARAITWLGCFLASTSLGMHVGVSPLTNGTSDLATIEHFVRTYPVPPEFAYQIMVHHTLAKFTSVVLENSQEAVSHSLVKIIDTELDSLKTKFPTPWTPRVEMAVLVAKMHLYTMAIIRMQSDLMSRNILMKTGFSVALRIVYLSDQGLTYKSADYSEITPEDLQRTLPKNHFRALVLATCFLLRFFALNIHATAEEQELARNHVAMAQRYFKAGSRGPQDEKSRAAALFEVLSRQQPVNLDNSKLKIDDRMGASLVYDAITTGHEIRDMPNDVEEGTSPNNPANNTAQLQSNEPVGFPMSANYQALDIDISHIESFAPLDFSLPEDLWGDSIWGMFDNMAPASHM